MTRLFSSAVVLSFCLAPACGGSSPPPKAPEAEAEPAIETPEPEVQPQPEAEPIVETEPDPKATTTAPEPKFTEGMSVNEAINAVPAGTERLNLDQEAMGKPLVNMKLYEPCKARANQKVKIRVAVWQGKAVGIDVSVKPPSEKLASCIKEQIRGVEWKDKVPSLNTVEFSF